MSYFDDVGDFHRKFDLPRRRRRPFEVPNGHRMITDEEFLFRYQFLQEELQELLRAHRADDLPGVADALADLVYVALGTAHFYQLPFDAVWAEVQRANMEKIRAADADDERSKRKHPMDVVKPEGWRPPDIEKVLKS